MRREAGHRKVFAVATPQQPVVDQALGHCYRAQRLDLGFFERHFCCRTKELRTQNVGVDGIDHDPFDGLVQQCSGVVHQICVQRIVTGDQHHQRALAAAPRPPGLLPERRDRALVVARPRSRPSASARSSALRSSAR